MKRKPKFTPQRTCLIKQEGFNPVPSRIGQLENFAFTSIS